MFVRFISALENTQNSFLCGLPPLHGPFWSVKYINFWPKATDSGSSSYFSRKKRYWSYWKSLLCIFHQLEPNTHFFRIQLMAYIPLLSSEIFLIFSHFLLSKSWVVRELMRQLVYTMFITNNHASFHLWREENLLKYQNVSKYNGHDYLQNFVLLFMSLLRVPLVKNSRILAGIYSIFPRKRPRPNLKVFQYQICTSV